MSSRLVVVRRSNKILDSSIVFSRLLMRIERCCIRCLKLGVTFGCWLHVYTHLCTRTHTLGYTSNAKEARIDDGSINIGVLCNQPPIWCHCADSSVGSFLILFSWPARQSLLFLMHCTHSDARGYATPSAGWSVYLGLRAVRDTYDLICKIDWKRTANCEKQILPTRSCDLARLFLIRN